MYRKSFALLLVQIQYTETHRSRTIHSDKHTHTSIYKYTISYISMHGHILLYKIAYRYILLRLTGDESKF